MKLWNYSFARFGTETFMNTWLRSLGRKVDLFSEKLINGLKFQLVINFLLNFVPMYPYFFLK